tara:strand:- start:5798 stop:6229 length:432 start_codon:yes stop_codon:yes gene_type:complete
MNLDPDVWGPHYWFMLHTTALNYPTNPNTTTKKKFYDFIHNLPLFIPHRDISDAFAKVLDKYPLTPYLENKKSFMKWMHFVHNYINKTLNKPPVDYYEAIDKYYNHYKPKKIIDMDTIKFRNRMIYIGLIIILLCIANYFYDK